MKKILFSLLILTFAGAMAFAEEGIEFVLHGILSNQKGDGFTLQDQNNTYNDDLVRFYFDGKNVGAQLKLSSPNGVNEKTVQVQSALIYLKPIPTVKVSFGSVATYAYTDQLSWWKVPDAATYASAGFSNSIGSSGDAGVSVETTALPNFTLTALASPGFEKGLLTAEGANLKYGGVVKYDLKGFGSVTAAFREGKNAHDDHSNAYMKRLYLGAELQSVANLYAFSALVGRIDSNDSKGLDGLAIDTYAKYTLQSLILEGHLPVTLRFTGAAGDVNYFGYDAKVSYDLPAFKLTPYVEALQDTISLSSRKMLPTLKVGTALTGYDSCSIDVNFEYNVVEGGQNTWSIPFNLDVKL